MLFRKTERLAAAAETLDKLTARSLERQLVAAPPPGLDRGFCAAAIRIIGTLTGNFMTLSRRMGLPPAQRLA
jgi:hypothetical protein